MNEGEPDFDLCPLCYDSQWISVPSHVESFMGYGQVPCPLCNSPQNVSDTSDYRLEPAQDLEF